MNWVVAVLEVEDNPTFTMTISPINKTSTRPTRQGGFHVWWSCDDRATDTTGSRL